jgi:mycofactocin precursor
VGTTVSSRFGSVRLCSADITAPDAISFVAVDVCLSIHDGEPRHFTKETQAMTSKRTRTDAATTDTLDTDTLDTDTLDTDTLDTDTLDTDTLIEDVSIDGMCGVY